MSEAKPIVIQFTLAPEGLPESFEVVKQLAAPNGVLRMGVIEDPEGWVVQCEILREDVDRFRDALEAGWEAL